MIWSVFKRMIPTYRLQMWPLRNGALKSSSQPEAVLRAEKDAISQSCLRISLQGKVLESMFLIRISLVRGTPGMKMMSLKVVECLHQRETDQATCSLPAQLWIQRIRTPRGWRLGICILFFLFSFVVLEFELRAYPFCEGFFRDRVSQTICPGWL
jgi:hypothetical protein